MLTKTLSKLVLGALAVGVLSIPMTLSLSQAQNPPQVPPAGPRDMQQRPGMGMGMMGGQATMVVDGGFLYILRGNQLLKVDKNTLRVAAQSMLPMPEMPSMPQGQGIRERIRDRQGGGGGRQGNPPPPTQDK